MSLHRWLPAALGVALAAGFFSPPAEADEAIPAKLSLRSALEVFRARGFDRLLADSTLASAAGDLEIATAVQNPTLSLGAGKNFQCAGSQDCQVISYSIGLSDNFLLSDLLNGKRGLRRTVANAALEAARGSRDDALRTLEFTLKQVYLQALLARAQLEVAKETRDSNQETRRLNERRFALGAMNEADLALTQVAALEAEQALDQAEQNLRAAKVAVAFLLGVRTLVPEFELDWSELDEAPPGPLLSVTRESLLLEAKARRPDLRALAQQQERAEAALRLARRNRFPDIGVGVNYSANGSGDTNISPPNASIGLSFAPPIFYRQAGEIAKAEADLVTQSILKQKVEAQVVADVETAFAQLTGSRRLVERMKRSLLERAQTARDLVKVQYEKGGASLLDLLNAQRIYSATRGVRHHGYTDS